MPANFEDAYDTFTSVEKQIESATVFIINKVDEADEAAIERVRQIVARHHPEPEFIETVFADIPLEKYLPTAGQAAGKQCRTFQPRNSSVSSTGSWPRPASP